MIRSLRACAAAWAGNGVIAAVIMFQLQILIFSGPVITSLTTLCPFPSISQYQFSDFRLRLPRSFQWLLAGPRAGLPQLRAGAVGRSRAPLGPLSHSLAGLLNDHSVTPGFSGPGGRRQKGENQACPCRAALAGKAPFNGKARRKPGLVPCLPVQSWPSGRYCAMPA